MLVFRCHSRRAEDAHMSCIVFFCRQPSATSLTDIIADSGRPVRLRFSCSIDADSQAREQQLPITMDLKQALCNLNVLRLSEGSGELCRVLTCRTLLVHQCSLRYCSMTLDYKQLIW